METEYDKELLLYITNNRLSDSIKINEQVDDVIEKIDSDFEKYLEKAKMFLEKIEKRFPYLYLV